MDVSDGLGGSSSVLSLRSGGYQCADGLVTTAPHANLIQEPAGLITEFARNIGVAPGIVAGRLQHEGIIGFNVGHKLFERYRFVEKS